MRVPLSWLAEFVDIKGLSAREIAEELSLKSVEAQVFIFGIPVEGVVVGKVLSRKPFKEGLYQIEVSVGREKPLNIVTADPKVSEGIRVIVAPAGARIGEREIKPKSFGHLVSEGVLLSAEDLGIEESSQEVIRFTDDIPEGTPVEEVLGIGEEILELDITPNRGDLLSVRGLAREVSAIFGREKLRERPVPKEDFGSLDVEIRDPDCGRYRGVIIEGIKVEDSPLWIKKRLWQSGQRPINNVVDITNYVMIQEGQPLHAFDLGKLEGGIIVRSAQNGEEVVTLDGVKRKLKEENLVIADHEKVVAVAGVMGSENSGVSQETRSILLESAYFNPSRIRRSSKALGLSTESSYRFERNVDIEGVSLAQEVAVDLILSLCGGKITAIKDNYPQPYSPKKIFLPLGKFIRYAGESYDKEEVSRILNSLEIPHTLKRCGLEVLVPSHRSFDMDRDVDVIEEIMRIKGYENYPAEETYVLSKAKMFAPLEEEVRDLLKNKGLTEVINLSFESKDLYDLLGLPSPEVEIVNPLVKEDRFLRRSLLPGLLRTASLNDRDHNYDQALFEVGAVFEKEGEPKRVALLVKGLRREFPREEWNGFAFLDLVNALGQAFGREVILERPQNSLDWLHPFSCGALVVDGRLLGYFGRLNPKIQERLELRGKVYVGEFSLPQKTADVPIYNTISRFPPVSRDLALLVDKSLSVSKLLNEIKSQVGEMLERVSVFDLYVSEKIGEGKKSVGVRLVFRSAERSLSGEEVNEVVEALVKHLRDSLGAELR